MSHRLFSLLINSAHECFTAIFQVHLVACHPLNGLKQVSLGRVAVLAEFFVFLLIFIAYCFSVLVHFYQFLVLSLCCRLSCCCC